MINQELLKSLFDYCPITGVFKRIGRLTKNGGITVCNFVGTAKSTHGYFQYTIKDKTYDVHRLIFLFVTGEFPDQDVDHINGDRTDNRWSNLRAVTRSENLRNVGRKNENESGTTGVGFNKNTNKWRVWIQSDFYDGFLTKQDAINFRKAEEIRRSFSPEHFQREVWK
jgi:hypothetical protein